MTLPIAISPEQQRALERFYFYEARLLDNRQYQQWLALVSQDIRYTVPARTNPLVDNRERGEEHMISVERELERTDSTGCPVREETFVHLALRVERAYKINSWAENPPARTRRIVGNIELMSESAKGLEVWSNFHLHIARPGSADTTLAGQRRDLLATANDGDPGPGFLLLQREVILDYALINAPTLGLLF